MKRPFYTKISRLDKTVFRFYAYTLVFANIFGSSLVFAASPPPASIPNVGIDCSNSSCTPNFTVNDNHPGNNYNAIDVGSNTANVNVTVQSKQAPRNLRMSIVNGAFPDGTTNPGFDLNVNLNSSTPNSSAGNFVLLGDNFKNLNIKLSGYIGGAGKDASKICADNVKAGLYGADSLSFFNNLRLNNPSIDKNHCGLDDINYLQSSKFACPSGFNEVLTSNSIYSVNIQRIPKINRCQTSLTYDVCLKRKTQLSCEWTIYNGNSTLNGNLTSGNNQIQNTYTVIGNISGGSGAISLSSNAPTTIAVGQPIIGAGINPGTTVSGISGNTIYMTSGANATASGVPFLIGVTQGQSIWGPGIPTGTKISSILSNGTIVALTNNVTITNTGVSLSSAAPTNYGANISRTLPENEYYYLRNIQTDADICGSHVAQEISDSTYVPQGSTANFLGNTAIQQPAISNASNFQGSTTINSTQIVFSSLPAGVTAGQPIYGLGIQPNTIIQSINNSIITLSAPATATASNISFLAGPQVGQTVSGNGIQGNTSITAIAIGGAFSVTTAGNKTVSAVSPSTSNLVVGQVVSGALIPTGTVITSIVDSSTFLISNNATSSGTDTFVTTNTVIMSSNSNLTQSNVSLSATSQKPVVNPLYSNANSYAGCTGACFWKVSAVTSTLTTPGMIGDQLAPGSNWELVNTSPGQQCDSSTNPQTGFFGTYKTVTVNYVAYDQTDASCKISDIETFSGGTPNHDYPAQSIDPNKQAVWFYSGVGQEPDFGTEVIQCDLGNCPVSSVVSDLVQGLDTISPTDGEPGTQQGNGLLFIYDAQNVVTEDNIGIAGAGGKNDIINQATTRVCAKIRDATSDGLASDYARTPLVAFDRFNWQALKTASSGNPGQQPVNNGNQITIWKKIDSSVRALLQNELFHQ